MKVLITGANGGFGALIVKTLLKDGHKVVGTLRDIELRNKAIAEEFIALGARIVEMDVTNDQSVQSGVNKAIQTLGGLDVTINNAGVGALGIEEQFTIDDFKRLFDINVFGVQRVNRAVIPHFRKQRSGLLVHISSLLGRITLPFYGPYSASKWALEAMAETYRVELSAWGVESCILEPGGYPTTFMTSLMKPSDTSISEGYGAMADAPTHAIESFEGALAANPAQDPQNVANAIADLISMPAGARPARTTVDTMGMGDHVEPYNSQLEQIHEGLYHAFGMEEMLKLKV